jgi:hypothetical protein
MKSPRYDYSIKIPRLKVPPRSYPLTDANIGAALYEINKAAKRRRDVMRRHSRGSPSHQKVSLDMQQCYELKDTVLEKAKREKLAVFVGFHSTLRFYDYDESRSTFACHEIGGFLFHTPALSAPNGTICKDLGTWESKANRSGTEMRLADAVSTLHAYLKTKTSRKQRREWMSKKAEREAFWLQEQQKVEEEAKQKEEANAKRMQLVYPAEQCVTYNAFSRARRARLTLARMSLALAVQMNGLGLSLWAFMYS